MQSIRRFFRSFVYAFRGLRNVARYERSFRLQLVAGAVVILSAMFLDFGMWERMLLILMVSGVLVLEVINSIFERISDAFKPRLSPVVKEVKDMMAGAVLISSITATVIGVMIFWAYFERL